jgi:predicted transposase YbfD/YdcC
VIHKLHDILVIAICAVIGGANGWAEVAQFGESKHDARAMAAAVRGHWAVENNLHWQLDVSFNED